MAAAFGSGPPLMDRLLRITARAHKPFIHTLAAVRLRLHKPGTLTPETGLNLTMAAALVDHLTLAT